MSKIKIKKYPIERFPNEKDDKSAYGFKDLWDENSVSKAIKESKLKGDISNFILSKLEIHPAGSCNLDCGFCYGKKLAPKKRTDLPLEAINNLFADIRKNMPDEEPFIVLSGLYSEPLTHPNIKEILKKIGDYGFRFALYTNGLLIDEEMINILLESASKSNMPKPNYISFNISATLDSKKFEEMLSVIQKINKKRTEKHKLNINAPVIVFPEQRNYNILKKIISKLDKAGTDNVRLSFPWKHRTPKKNRGYEPISKEEYKKTLEIFELLKKEFRKVKIRYIEEPNGYSRCFALSMALTIDSKGNIYPCPETAFPFYKKLSYGNITKEKISKIWHGKKHINLFKSFNPKMEKCVCCPVDEKFNNLCWKYWKEN